MQTKKHGSILVLLDDRLTRERVSFLTQVLGNLRHHHASVKTVPAGASEAEFIGAIDQHQKQTGNLPQLILAPWYRYLTWGKAEAYLGPPTRTSGPTFAGYHAEPLLPYEMGESADRVRTLILDFCTSGIKEIALMVQLLLHERTKTGIRPFFDAQTPIFCENWFIRQGLGMRLDSILSLPEFAQSRWAARSNAVRICLLAFWNLVYEEGPGKSDLHQAITMGTPKAYFQIAMSNSFLTLRLMYSMPSWTPITALSAFWPNPKDAAAASQLLLRHCDFLRVHRVTENADIEIVAGFLASGPSQLAPEQVHTYWIEPVSMSQFVETPFEVPGKQNPQLRALPAITIQDFGNGQEESLRSELKAKERHIQEAHQQARELRREIAELRERIEELRYGGVGTAPPLPPPDAETLLEAFQEKFLDARFQIRQIELRIHEMEKNGATAQQVELLRQKIAALSQKELAWIRKIEQTLKIFREERAKTPGKDG